MKKSLLILTFQLFAFLPFVNASYVIGVNQSTNGILIDNQVLQNEIRTIEFWFKPSADLSQNSFAEYQALVARDNSLQTEEWGIYLNHTDGSLRFFRRVAQTNYEISADTVSWSSGKYYHIVGVIDPQEGMSLYVDGKKQTDTDTSSAAIIQNSDPTYIGKWGDLSIRHFDGELENFRMWSRALDSTEVVNLDCDVSGDYITGLELWLDMESLSVTQGTISDASPNNYTLTFSGTVNHLNNNLCTRTTNVQTTQSNFDIYPNPSAGEINISSHLNINQIEVYNLLGENIFTYRGNIKTIALNKGVFILKIEDETGNVTVSRVIVQ